MCQVMLGGRILPHSMMPALESKLRAHFILWQVSHIGNECIKGQGNMPSERLIDVAMVF